MIICIIKEVNITNCLFISIINNKRYIILVKMIKQFVYTFVCHQYEDAACGTMAF